MPVKERFPGFPPGGAVALVGTWIALVTFIGFRCQPCMLLAVPSFGEIGTTRMAARSLGLVGHVRVLLRAKKKAREDFPSFVWTCLSVQYRGRHTEHNCYFLII
jgi:hypothetical protein